MKTTVNQLEKQVVQLFLFFRNRTFNLELLERRATTSAVSILLSVAK